MTEHSPLLWTVGEWGGRPCIKYPVEDLNGWQHWVPQNEYYLDGSPQNDAEFICRVVNTHQPLVEAVEYTLALLRTGLAPDGMFAKEEDWLRHKCNKAAGELAAALAAAKGEKG